MPLLELSALRGDNPTGFLAACGLLQCVSQFPPDDSASFRLSWTTSADRISPVAILESGPSCDIGTISRSVRAHSDWQKCLIGSARVGRQGCLRSRETFRQVTGTLLRQLPAHRRDVDFWSVLASDAGSDAKGPFKSFHTLLDFGSANQNLLPTLVKMADALLARMNTTGDEVIREALYGPWQYNDKQRAFGWDPATQRLHALRGKEPTNDDERCSTLGPVYLVGAAIPLFPSFVCNNRLRTAGFYTDNEKQTWFRWPIWNTPISLETLRSLLACPLRDIRGRPGIQAIYKSQRCHTGNKGGYHVFSFATGERL